MPSKQTLQKYGLTQQEFDTLLEHQGGVCPICKKVPSTGRWVIDHEHIRGWKSLPPEQRKLYVRGILCWLDNNKALTKGMTLVKARRLVEYLERYENLRDSWDKED